MSVKRQKPVAVQLETHSVPEHFTLEQHFIRNNNILGDKNRT